MISKKVIIIGIIGAVVIMTWFVLKSSPEDQVTERFDQLAELVSKDASQPPLAQAAKVKGVSNLFVDGCVVEIKAAQLSGVYSRQHIMERAMMAQRYFSIVQLEFHDLTITFPNDNTAKVLLTGQLSGSSTGGDIVSETRSLDCELEKRDGDWFFTKMVEVRAYAFFRTY